MICRLLALLLILLTLGGCGMFDSGSPQDHPFDHPENALSDEQTRAQVVDPVVQVVRAVALDDVTAGFSFGSCNDQGEPPFQGRAEMAFKLPAVDPGRVYAQIRDAMIRQGWSSGSPQGQVVHGDSLNRDGVMATVGPRPSDPGYGSLHLYGQCRNAGDHGSEGAVDITDQLR